MDREKKLYEILPSIHKDEIKKLLRKDLLILSKLENISIENIHYSID